MKKDLTELVFIIDRSGSMCGLEDDTIGGFNGTLDAHRKEAGEALVTTVLFDNDIEILHDRVPLETVNPMTSEEYFVRGCTALLDAVGTTIKHINSVQGYLPEEYRPEHTIVVITTDGMENASHEFSYKQVRALIEEMKAKGWDFLFLGANIDAAAEAAMIGISPDCAATYIADGSGTQAMHRGYRQESFAKFADPLCCHRSGCMPASARLPPPRHEEETHPDSGACPIRTRRCT